MKIKGLIDEDFVNYKKPSMFIIMPYCDGKCNVGHDTLVCQNYNLMKDDESILDIDISSLVERYISNPITEAIVIGGLEPFDSSEDLFDFIRFLRVESSCNDDLVIYTGYTEKEVKNRWFSQLQQFNNIIIKYGRFIPNQKSHYDELLGVYLASDNQYAKKILE